MAFGLTIAIIGAAATIGSAALSASKSGGAQETTSTQTSKLEFPEETRRLFQDVEKPLLASNLAEQAGFLSPFLGGFRNTPYLNEQYGGVGNVAKSATRKAASQAGIGDLGPAFENIEGLTPELLQSLRSLVLARGAQINSIVPPGYTQFLAPANYSESTQEPAKADPYKTGFQLAQSGTQIVGALNSAGAFGP